MLVFAVHRYGRGLGLDAIIIDWMASQPSDARFRRHILALVT
jgi:hypothetical protein